MKNNVNIILILLILILSSCRKENIQENQKYAESFYWRNKDYLMKLSNDTTRKNNLFFSIENDSTISLEVVLDSENVKYDYEINAKNYKQSESIKYIDSISQKYNINIEPIYRFFYDNDLHRLYVFNKNTSVDILKVKFDIDYEIIITTKKNDYKTFKEDISKEIDSNVYFYYNSRPQGWFLPFPKRELIK